MTSICYELAVANYLFGTLLRDLNLLEANPLSCGRQIRCLHFRFLLFLLCKFIKSVVRQDDILTI